MRGIGKVRFVKTGGADVNIVRGELTAVVRWGERGKRGGRLIPLVLGVPR